MKKIQLVGLTSLSMRLNNICFSAKYIGWINFGFISYDGLQKTVLAHTIVFFNAMLY